MANHICLKVAAFEAPISGWFWAPLDNASRYGIRGKNFLENHHIFLAVWALRRASLAQDCAGLRKGVSPQIGTDGHGFSMSG